MENENEIVIDPVEQRRTEVAQYEANIALYTKIASTLPAVWPAELESYKTRKDRHQAIAEIADMDDVVLVSDLWAHDDAVAAIRSETVEMRKAQAILNAIS
jgi:hypothetical protein